MRRSCIRFGDAGQCTSNNFWHNTREQKATYLLADRSEDFICKGLTKNGSYESIIAHQAKQNHDDLICNRKAIYERTKKRKLQAKTRTQLSAVIVLDEHHSEDHLIKLIAQIEAKLDTKVTQYAIHRDEGHKDIEGNIFVNHHAHIELLGLDSNGLSVSAKLNKKMLRELQEITAQTLDMSYTKNSGRCHHKHREFRALKEQERLKNDGLSLNGVMQKVKNLGGFDNLKSLKAEAQTLREQLKTVGANREHYAELEANTREQQRLLRVEKTLKKVGQVMLDHGLKSVNDLKKTLHESERQHEEINDLTKAIEIYQEESIEMIKSIEVANQVIEDVQTVFGLSIKQLRQKAFEIEKSQDLDSLAEPKAQNWTKLEDVNEKAPDKATKDAHKSPPRRDRDGGMSM
jgi:phosphotransferase system IIB component